MVVGYGYSTKRSFTVASSSVSSIKSQKRKAYHHKISNAFKGKVAGVEIKNANNDGSISIRGAASMKKHKEPLYIVDGIPIQYNYNQIIKNLDKNDIEKVDVYKPYKSKKIFGASAKNGCILIITKKGNLQIRK